MKVMKSLVHNYPAWGKLEVPLKDTVKIDYKVGQSL